MHIRFARSALFALFALPASCLLADEGFTPLFNGKDFTGWKVPEGDNGHWKVVGGVIDYDARSEAKGEKSLWTEKEYRNFTLKVDWRLKETPYKNPRVPIILPDGTHKLDENGKEIQMVVPDSDSGIFVRGSQKSQVNIWCWPIGSGEVYGYRMDQKMPPAVRAGVTPRINADKHIGQWNRFEITVKGDRLTVVLNGKTAIENAQLPGLPDQGPIGLQHHGAMQNGVWTSPPSLVQFRGIEIKELGDVAAGGKLIDDSVGYVLDYEVDRAAHGLKSGDRIKHMDDLIRALNRRLAKLAVARAKEEGKVEVQVFGTPGKEQLQHIKLLLGARGTLGFGVLANLRDHASLIKIAHELKPTEKSLLDDEEEELARWAPIASAELVRILKADWKWSKDKPEEITNGRGFATRTVTSMDGKSEQHEILVRIEFLELREVSLTKADPALDVRGDPAIQFALNREGTQHLAKLTKRFAPSPDGFRRGLAIIVDGAVHEVPMIAGVVADGIGYISEFREKDGREKRDAMISVLRGGQFPYRIRLTGESPASARKDLGK